MQLDRKYVKENFPFAVVVGLIEKDDKILLVQERKIEVGKWNLPGGWLDKGEDIILGAARESKEETGCEIKILDFLGIYSLIRKFSKPIDKIMSNDIQAVKIVFSGKIIGGEPKPDGDEILNVKWFSKEEIFSMTGKELRDMDIKNIVRDYFSGKKYPLEAISHFTSKEF